MGVKVREKIKGSGVWWVFISHNGQRKSKKIGPHKLAKQAAKQVEKQLVLNDCGLISPKQPIKTFGEYSKIWLTLTAVRPGTLYGYKLALKNHVLPYFSQKEITAIKRIDIKQFLVGKLNAGYSLSTIGNYKAVISEVLQVALDDEAISVNHAKNLGKLAGRVAGSSKKIKPIFFDRNELAKILNYCLKYYPEDYPFLLTLARTGMRKGEAMALKWSDIAQSENLITVKRAWSDMGMGLTKSGKERKVDMSMQLAMVLKQLKVAQQKAALLLGKTIGEFVFPSPKRIDRPKDIKAFQRRHLPDMLEKVGIRRCRVHDIRHSYASLLIAAGESLVYVRDQLGHSTIQITADTYGHLLPGSNRAAVNQLDDEQTRYKEAL